MAGELERIDLHSKPTGLPHLDREHSKKGLKPLQKNEPKKLSEISIYVKQETKQLPKLNNDDENKSLEKLDLHKKEKELPKLNIKA